MVDKGSPILAFLYAELTETLVMYRQHYSHGLPTLSVFRDAEGSDLTPAPASQRDAAASPGDVPPEVEELTDEQLLLASPLLCGFSLSDKLWRACLSITFLTES